MVIFSTTFSEVSLGSKFSIINERSDPTDRWSHEPLLKKCVKLLEPTQDGFNAVDEYGAMLKLADDAEVMKCYGHDR